MQVPHFSSEERQLRSLEARLSAGKLTIGQIRDIEDQILLRISDKTARTANQALSQLENARSRLVEKKIAASPQNLDERMQRLALLRFLWPPSDVEEEIGQLKLAASLLDPENPKFAAIARQLEKIEFSHLYPIVRELDSEIVSTFASRIRKVARQILKQNSTQPFDQHLNAEQQRQVLLLTGGQP